MNNIVFLFYTQFFLEMQNIKTIFYICLYLISVINSFVLLKIQYKIFFWIYKCLVSLIYLFY
jgi:hypothetical protein